MPQLSPRAMAGARDAGLARVRTWTRGVLVTGLVATGVASTAVAHALPGRSHPRTPGPSPQQQQTSQAPNPAPAAPAQPPAPTYQAPVTTSGGS